MTFGIANVFSVMDFVKLLFKKDESFIRKVVLEYRVQKYDQFISLILCQPFSGLVACSYSACHAKVPLATS